MAKNRALPLRAPVQRKPSIIKRLRNVLEAALGFNGDNLELIAPYTVWDDIQGNLIGKRLNSTSGKVDYNHEENAITMSPGGSITNINDHLALNLQMKHQKKLGTALRFHLHFWQLSSDVLTFTLRYRHQINGQAKTEGWTTITCNTTDDNVFPYVSGTLDQIIRFPEIPLVDEHISDMVQIQFVRDDNTADDIDVTFADAHIEIDSFGSAGEITKWTED